MKTIEGLSDNTRKAYEQSLWLLNGDIQGEEPTEKEMQKYKCQPLIVSSKSDAESFANEIELYLKNT